MISAVRSVLFLGSGYLALIEVCHAWWRWQPSRISWWVTFINRAVCVGLMISACFAFVLSEPVRVLGVDAVTIATDFTLQGALCFLLDSALLLPETALEVPADGS